MQLNIGPSVENFQNLAEPEVDYLIKVWVFALGASFILLLVINFFPEIIQIGFLGAVVVLGAYLIVQSKEFQQLIVDANLDEVDVVFVIILAILLSPFILLVLATAWIFVSFIFLFLVCCCVAFVAFILLLVDILRDVLSILH